MLEMVLAKADASIAEQYEQRLCDNDASLALGGELRVRLSRVIELVNELKQQDHLLVSEPSIARSLSVRDPYTDPLHFCKQS